MNHHRRSAQVWHVLSRDFTVLPAHPHVHPRSEWDNKPCLPLPSQPQLVLIYRPRRDGRLSRSWYVVALAEIRTCNLPTANPALYRKYPATPARVEQFTAAPATRHELCAFQASTENISIWELVNHGALWLFAVLHLRNTLTYLLTHSFTLTLTYLFTYLLI